MKIAATYDNGSIFQHFGHSKQFKLYEIADGAVKASSLLPTDGSGHCALADLLRSQNVDTLICGGIGAGAQNMLAKAGIKLYGGASGNADEAVTALLADRLVYNPNVQCSHHGDHTHGDCHSGHEHHCGDHQHGNHCHE